MAAITCHTLKHLSLGLFTGLRPIVCLELHQFPVLSRYDSHSGQSDGVSHARLTLEMCTIQAVDLGPLQRRMHVEQVGYEGQVELAVSRCDVLRRNKLSAVQPGRLSQHQLGPVVQVVLLHVHMKHVTVVMYI